MLGELEGEGRYVVGDLEAGTGTILRLRPGQVDVVVVVTQPTAKAIDVAARTVRVADHREIPAVVVANRVSAEGDLALVRAGVMGREVLAVPDDPAVRQADERGAAPLDSPEVSPAIASLQDVADRILELSEGRSC